MHRIALLAVFAAVAFAQKPPAKTAKGPVGRMTNAGTKPRGAAPTPPAVPTTPDFALGKVKLDKTAVILKAGDTEKLTITNSTPGTVSLSLAQALPGIEVTLDKANLNQNEKAVVTLKAGDNPFTGEMAFRVDP